MSRVFDSMNTAVPEALRALGEQPPACFDKRTWVVYLKECWREARDNAAARRRLERGASPDYCSDCEAAHRARCVAAKRCFPPAGSTPPPLENAHV